MAKRPRGNGPGPFGGETTTTRRGLLRKTVYLSPDAWSRVERERERRKLRLRLNRFTASEVIEQAIAAAVPETP